MRFEWPHKFVNELMAAYERCLPQPAFVEWMEKGIEVHVRRSAAWMEKGIEVHVRRSAASHKGWRTRKAMAKAREKP